MKRSLIFLAAVFAMVLLLSPGVPQAAGAANPSEQPKAGGILKVIQKAKSDVFGYPPRMVGAARNYAPPFFDHLLSVGDDGKYKPELALSWDVSKDGKAVTFKLRKGVAFHDGTPFNAQAVKANIDNLIPPKAKLLDGIASVDVVDDYTVRLNLPAYNNLILFHFAANPVTYMYSPEALKKYGVDKAMTNPVGTGPFLLKDYQPNISLKLVKNPNYWQKGLPYLEGMELSMVTDPMTQIMTLKAGQANAIYSAQESVAQLRDEGYPLQISQTGYIVGINFDTKNSEIFSKRQVREAIEYAIDKETICSGPGQGLFQTVYQIVADSSPGYNKTCPPRKYDPARAKQLLAEAGFPNGFSLKIFLMDTAWKDGFVAIQSYLDKVGVKMDINYLNTAAFNQIRVGGKIEKGAAGYHVYTTSTNPLFILDSFWRSNTAFYPYVVKPAGIDKLIDEAQLSRDSAAVAKISQTVVKAIYEDATVIPLWQVPTIAVVDKSVQNTGWFIYGDTDNNEFGTRTWLKK